MAYTISDLAITSVETVTAYDITTGAYLWMLDELQNVSIAQGEEKTDITGKQGRKITSLKRNKTVTVSGTNGMLNSGLVESQTGSSFTNGVTKVNWGETLTVSSGKATTTFTAIGTAGAEIKLVQTKNTDGTLGIELEQDSAAAEGKFAYDPATKELSFYSDISDGTEVFVQYDRQIQADVLANYSDKYSGKAHIYIDAMAEDKCGNVFRVQIEIPKGDFSGEATWEMGDNQAVHNFEIESLSGGCGNASKGSTLFIWTVFGANSTDVATTEPAEPAEPAEPGAEPAEPGAGSP